MKTYDGLVNFGYRKHYRVRHGENEFAKGKNHINGIENFWSIAKTRLSKFRGVHKSTFYLHLKESEIQSMYFAHLNLVRKMQKAGFNYCGEDSGVFGLHRNGPDIIDRLDNLFMWNEFICQFDAEKIKNAGYDPDFIFFKGMAYRIIWVLFWGPKTRELSFRYYGVKFNSDTPKNYHIKLFRIFNRISHLMRKRKILDDDKGVVYSHNGKIILWSFGSFDFYTEKNLQ